MKQCPQCGVRFRDRVALCPIDGARLVALPDPLIGRVIAQRYLVEELLGVGGMGSVYKGRHQVLGRTVALKFLSPKLMRDPEHKQRFLREARAASRVQHEHIIDVSDVGEADDGLAYMVMEHLVGRTLAQDVQRGPLPLQRACRIGAQLAFALGHAHELGVIHRDVKPGNVFLIHKGGDADFVKLLDFGLARAQDDIALTKSNTLCGTPEYLAPEQARGEPVGAKADLYALGCVLFELLTGRLPFEGNSTGLIYKHVHEPPPKLRALRSEIPEALEATVLRLLGKDPARRHASAYQLADELTRADPSLPRGTARASEANPQTPAQEAPTMVAHHEEERWRERLLTLRVRVSEKVPPGPEQAALHGAIDRLAGIALEARQLRQTLGELQRDTSVRDDHARSTRLRLGAAIAALAADEARADRDCDEVTTRLAAARQRLDREARRLLAAVQSHDAVRTGATGTGLTEAQLLRVTRDWAEAQAECLRVEQQLTDAQTARTDLRFQISHMKGRLAGIDTDDAANAAPSQRRATELEAQLNAKLYAVRLEAERLGTQLG